MINNINKKVEGKKINIANKNIYNIVCKTIAKYKNNEDKIKVLRVIEESSIDNYDYLLEVLNDDYLIHKKVSIKSAEVLLKGKRKFNVVNAKYILKEREFVNLGLSIALAEEIMKSEHDFNALFICALLGYKEYVKSDILFDGIKLLNESQHSFNANNVFVVLSSTKIIKNSIALACARIINQCKIEESARLVSKYVLDKKTMKIASTLDGAQLISLAVTPSFARVYYNILIDNINCDIFKLRSLIENLSVYENKLTQEDSILLEDVYDEEKDKISMALRKGVDPKSVADALINVMIRKKEENLKKTLPKRKIRIKK